MPGFLESLFLPGDDVFKRNRQIMRSQGYSGNAPRGSDYSMYQTGARQQDRDAALGGLAGGVGGLAQMLAYLHQTGAFKKKPQDQNPAYWMQNVQNMGGQDPSFDNPPTAAPSFWNSQSHRPGYLGTAQPDQLQMAQMDPRLMQFLRNWIWGPPETSQSGGSAG